MLRKLSSKGGSDIEPVPTGIHPAICYSVVDLGSHWTERFQKWNRQVLITWEFPHLRGEFTDGDGNMQDKPRVISNSYTPTLSAKANLRRDLVGWRGKEFTKAEEDGFDASKLLKASCQLHIVHNTSGDKTYANVQTVLPPADGMKKVLEPENPTVFFDLDEHGLDIPESVPDWVKEKIRSSREYEVLKGGGSLEGSEETPPETDTGDDIPF